MVSAQSWQGLGRDDDERYRISATADGGIWLMHTPYPEPLVQLAGTRRVLESAHKLIGGMWGEEGTTRAQHAWTADPDIIRHLDTGQACYIHRGGVTFVQVARPKPSPLSLPAADRPGPYGDHPAARAPTRRGRPAARAGEPGRRARTRSARMNPFTALGLPADPDLTDEQVRAAWRTIAAATHPDRPDGGDVTRYTAAATAYAQLRTAWGRSEAYADLTADEPYVPAPAPALPARPGTGMIRTVRLVPARIRHGRPVRLLLRAIVAAVLSLLVLRSGAGAAIRARCRDRPDHVVRADRARGSGPATGPVTNHDASGGGLRLGDAAPPGRAAARGWGGRLPVTSPSSRDKPSRPGRAGQGRSAVGCSTLTGPARPATPAGGTTAR